MSDALSDWKHSHMDSVGHSDITDFVLESRWVKVFLVSSLTDLDISHPDNTHLISFLLSYFHRLSDLETVF